MFTQTLGPFDDWMSERIAQRNPFPWTCQAGRAARSSGTTGGPDEALHAKKRRTEWAALEALLPEELERLCQLQRSAVGHVPEVERRSCSLRRSKRVRCHPRLGQVSKAREDRDDPMDVGGFGQWKGKELHWHWQRKRNRKRWCEIIGTSKHVENSRSVLELAGKQVINRRTAGQGHSSRVQGQ